MPQDRDRDTSPSIPAAQGDGSDEFGKTKAAIVDSGNHIAEEVKAAAGEAADQVKRAAESKLDAGRDFAAEHLGSVADALRKTGEELRSNDSGLTDYMTKAASSVDSLSVYLQTRTLSQLMRDVEGFARREPAMFLGGSFVLGLLGGRFFKSASPARAMRLDAARLGSATRAGHTALPAYAGQGAKRSSTPDAQSSRTSPSTWSATSSARSGDASPRDAESRTNAGSRPASTESPPMTGRYGLSSGSVPSDTVNPAEGRTTAPQFRTTPSNGGSDPTPRAGGR